MGKAGAGELSPPAGAAKRGRRGSPSSPPPAAGAAGGDRVVVLRLERPAGEARLVAELTGRHGNLFLVGADGVIRASAARNLSQRRALVPGQLYAAPIVPEGRSLEGGARAPRARSVRFAPVAGAEFPLSAAIEAAYAEIEAERLLAERRRRLREPVRAALARAGRALDRLADAGRAR